MKQSPAEVVISELGIRKLARDMGISSSTVLRWREGQGLIPAKHHARIIDLGDGRISTHDLVYGR